MKPFRLLATLAVLCLALPSLAQERPSGLVAVGDRLFLAPGQPDQHPTGEPPADVAHWMTVAVNYDDTRWFRALRDADPLLGPLRVQMMVKRLSEPPAVWLSDERIERTYGDRERVPPELRIEGYDVQTILGQVPPRDFVYRPLGPALDFGLQCHRMIDREGLDMFLSCQILATYPPDPSIVIYGGIYGEPRFQELAPDLPAIVARLREMAFCLDVTEAPPSDPEEALEMLLAANPRLEGCEGMLLS